tara:strand:+ start:485 stop:928 length:444 start_codon:yes stop_codon:yes gene_type:complete
MNTQVHNSYEGYEPLDILDENTAAIARYRTQGGWLYAVKFGSTIGCTGFTSIQVGYAGDIESYGSRATLLFDGPSDMEDFINDPSLREEMGDICAALSGEVYDPAPPKFAFLAEYSDWYFADEGERDAFIKNPPTPSLRHHPVTSNS